MASRTNVSAGITIAQLDGRARYHLEHQSPRDVALAELRAIGATPDLIRQAAESARRAHASGPVANWQSGPVADLLDALL